MASESEEETQLITIRSAALSLPPQPLKDLLSLETCGRCIFRLFGIHGPSLYSSSLLSTPTLRSVLDEPKGSLGIGTVDSGLFSNGISHSPDSSQASEDGETLFCSICLGVLQVAYIQGPEKCADKTLISGFALSIAQLVKREDCQIDSFSLELSIPPIILANERAIRLYMKNKYGSQDWFREKFLTEHISVKDALKLSITNSLEILLGVKSGVSSFHICLTYSHAKASLKLQSLLPKDHRCKRRKTGTDDSADNVDDTHVQTSTECIEQSSSESDAALLRTLDSLQDHEFCKRFIVPLEKVYEPCRLALHCYRMPIYIGGRYLKYSRNVSQTRWIIDDERIGEASVEEIIGVNVLPICKGDNFKFHAAGREDIDVRMLGSGRPFLVEVLNARRVPSSADIEEIEDKINISKDRFVKVRNLNLVGSQAWALMREGEAEKQKQYVALVWISRPLNDEDLQTISSHKDMDILQRTPIRVLHRRSPLERKRIIHWMTIEKVVGSCQYFLLHLCTQAGTYIKEFVHGDLGRTHPSIGSILGCRAEILQLDVTDVKMDCFN